MFSIHQGRGRSSCLRVESRLDSIVGPPLYPQREILVWNGGGDGIWKRSGYCLISVAGR